MSKICLDCQENKPLSDFYKGLRGIQGVQSYCKVCTNKRVSDRRKIKGRSDIKSKSGTKATILLRYARNRCRDKGLAYDLTPEWVQERLDKPCPMTGKTYVLDKPYHPLTPSLDKINPLGGYTKDNTRVVCYWYNTAKNMWKEDEVLDLCKCLVENSK